MRYLAVWSFSLCVGGSFLLWNPVSQLRSQETAPVTQDAIAELIKSRELSKALAGIQEMAKAGDNDSKVRVLQMQWFSALRAGVPKDVDANQEARNFLDATMASIRTTPNRLNDLPTAMVLAMPFIKSSESEEYTKSILEFVDSPECQSLGVPYYRTLNSIHKNLSMSMRREGKEAQVAEMMQSDLARFEKYLSDNPDATLGRSTMLSIMTSVIANSPADKAKQVMDKASAMFKTWIDDKPTSDIVSSYGSMVAVLASSNARSNPDLAEQIIVEGRALLEDAVAKDESMEKPVATALKSLDGLTRTIESAKLQLAMIGKPAPPMDAMEWVNGSPLSADDLKGKVVLLDFWAVWCGPCIATFPELKKLHEEYSEKGLTIIGVTNQYGYTWDEDTNKAKAVKDRDSVSLEDELAMLKKFMQSYDLHHRSMVIPLKSDMKSNYGVTGIPHVALIDQSGIVRLIKVGSGANNAKTIEAKIKELLAIE